MMNRFQLLLSNQLRRYTKAAYVAAVGVSNTASAEADEAVAHYGAAASATR